jgi:hypothetical protein
MMVECCAYPGTGAIVISGVEPDDIPAIATPNSIRQERDDAVQSAAEACIVWLGLVQEQEWFKRLPEGYRRFDLQRRQLLLEDEGTGKVKKVKADLHIHFPPRPFAGNGNVAASIALAVAQVMRGAPFYSLIGALGEFTPTGQLLPMWPTPQIEKMADMAHALFYAAPPENEENLDLPGGEGMDFKGFSHMDKMLQYAYKWDKPR